MNYCIPIPICFAFKDHGKQKGCKFYEEVSLEIKKFLPLFKWDHCMHYQPTFIEGKPGVCCSKEALKSKGAENDI